MTAVPNFWHFLGDYTDWAAAYPDPAVLEQQRQRRAVWTQRRARIDALLAQADANRARTEASMREAQPC